MKNKKLWLLYPLLCLFLVFGLAVPASAVNPVQSFYGDLTIYGEDAPVGTFVIAKVAGMEFQVTTVTLGEYGRGLDPKLVVQGEIEDGATVDFYVTSAALGLDEVKTIETALFDDGKITELDLTVGVVLAPVAGFSASPLTGDEPLTVVFTDESENMAQSPTWSWDFGDGGTSTVENPTHEYLQDDSYTVTLTVTTDEGSDSEVKADYIVVADTEPVASFTADPTSGDYPLEVSFTDTSSSYDGIISWEWDFSYIEGLGFNVESTVQHPVYTYQTEDIHTVALRVSEADADSNMKVAEDLITVTAPTPPTVVSTSPLDAAIDVAVDATVSATFHEDIQAGANFNGIVISGATGVSASIDGAILTIAHDAFAEGTQYTATIPAGAVEDLAGNPNALHTWSFTTITVVPDTTPPAVLSTSPGDGATGVAVDATVSATFDEDIQAGANFNGIDISGATGVSASIDGAILTIAHDAFAEGTQYTVTIPAGAVEDLAGNPNALHTWSFTTVTPVPDTTPPAVLSTSPGDGATGVAVDATVSATFDEDVTAVDLSGITIAGATGVSVTLDEATDTITIAHDDFALSTSYTVTIPAGAVQDLASIPNANALYTWSFTTATGNLQDLIDETDPGGTLVLEAGTYTGNVTIDKPITITGIEGTIISGGIHVAPLVGSNVTIENLTITDYSDYGIWIELVDTDDVFTIRNNTIEGVEGSLIGIQVDEVEAGGILEVEQNSISGNEIGIKLLEAVVTGNINFNNIVGNEVGLELLRVDHWVGASYNWWGDISGPEEENRNPGGLGDTIELPDGLGYDPWLTREFQTVLDDNIAYFGYPWVWLYTGWNIMSTPIALDPLVEWVDSDNISRTGVDTWGDYVGLGDGLSTDNTSPAYRFDGQSQAWVALSSDSSLKPCDAIYVRMASDDIAPILYSANVSVPSKELYSGWNLVSLAWLPSGMDGLYGMPANEALVTVEEVSGGLTGYKLVVSPSVNDYERSWIYIAGQTIEPWTDPNVWPPPDGYMLITSGYWVFMLNDGTLAGFTFTPVSLPMP